MKFAPYNNNYYLYSVVIIVDKTFHPRSSGIGLTFGNLANTGGGLGSDSVGFGSTVGGLLGFVDSPVFGSRGGSTSTDFGALAGGSIGSGTSGNQSSL